MGDATRIPVIAAIGEYVDRPESLDLALEPVALMERAIRACEADSGRGLAAENKKIRLICLICWRYRDPGALLCAV